MDNLSYQEIAQELGITYNRVDALLNKEIRPILRYWVRRYYPGSY